MFPPESCADPAFNVIPCAGPVLAPPVRNKTVPESLCELPVCIAILPLDAPVKVDIAIEPDKEDTPAPLCILT